MAKLHLPHGTLAYDIQPNPSTTETVILIHGLTLDHQMWSGQYEVLQPYHVLAPDLRGHGASCDFDRLSVEEAADDLAALIAWEDVESFVLVGISLGGLVVQAFARRYGGATGYMVISATPAYLDCYTYGERMAMESLPWVLPFVPEALFPEAAANLVSFSTPGRALVRASTGAAGSAQFALLWQVMAQAYQPAEMTFDAPLAAVYGALDYFGVVHQHLSDWQRAYPQATLYEIPDANHMVTHDNALAFNALLVSFLQRCFASENPGNDDAPTP